MNDTHPPTPPEAEGSPPPPPPKQTVDLEQVFDRRFTVSPRVFYSLVTTIIAVAFFLVSWAHDMRTKTTEGGQLIDRMGTANATMMQDLEAQLTTCDSLQQFLNRYVSSQQVAQVSLPPPN